VRIDQVLLQHSVLGEDDVAPARDRLYLHRVEERDAGRGKAATPAPATSGCPRLARALARGRGERPVDRVFRLTPAPSAPRLWRFRWIGAVEGCSRSRRTEEEFPPIRKGDVPAVCPEQRMVARLIPVDDDLGADLEGFFRDAPPEERVRRTALDHPLFDGAVRFCHVQVNPGMGIHPLDLRDDPLQQNRPVRIEFSSEGMVRRDRRGRPEGSAHYTNTRQYRSHPDHPDLTSFWPPRPLPSRGRRAECPREHNWLRGTR